MAGSTPRRPQADQEAYVLVLVPLLTSWVAWPLNFAETPFPHL